ncbi:MAG: helix-turn-helix domain-containing protein [Bacillota bacterium]
MKKKHFILLFVFELILVAASIYILMPKPDLTTKVQAISMNLTNYKFDYYVGNNVIKTGDIGTASYTFGGLPAFYDVNIAYVDEDDGNSAYTLIVNGDEIKTWLADKNPKKDRIFVKTVHNVKLSGGNELTIMGTRDKGESARVAYIEIVYSHGIAPGSLLKYALDKFMEGASIASILPIVLIIIIFLIANILAFALLRRKNQSSYEVDKEIPISLSDGTFAKSNEAETDIDKEDPKPSEYIFDNKPPENPLVDQMVSYLEKNYTDCNFSVQIMADHFNLSLNYLSSFFKEQTGQNIVYYLTNLRIEKAKQLLGSTDLPIKNVAENSGYFNVSSFIRRFKQITGFTPGEYRSNKKDSYSC